MATNLSLDPALIEQAVKLGGERTKKMLAQLCIRHDLTLLTTDGDFSLIAKHSALRVWTAAR
jgi:predicted nucleic acid-binding protein